MASPLLKVIVAVGINIAMRLGWPYRLMTIVAIFFGTGGAPKNQEPPEVPHKLTADSSEEVVRRAVPLGMPLADARRIMEKKGFKCRLSADKDGTQSLGCRIWEPHGFLVSRVRKVFLDMQDGRVSRVWFVEGFIGP
jgi:hypothetical protein